MVVAASINNVIGVDGELPWHIPEDLKRFKQLTMGKPMIMGRLTFESIGRALPGRRSIVLTRQSEYLPSGGESAATPDAALTLAGDVPEVMVIGGGQVYRQMLPLTERIYMTRVLARTCGDTRFPALKAGEWTVIESEEFPTTGERAVAYRFETLQRKGSG